MNKDTASYQQRLCEHLADYKQTKLGALPDGIWVTKKGPTRHAHILPTDQFQLNILATIRESFWSWLEQPENRRIKRHKYFHHLNSSQALAFNLFFPFLREDGKTVDPRLTEALGIKAKGTFKGCFEKVFPKHEGTNFDFYLEADDEQRYFFEIKLSENEFGSRKDHPDQGRIDRHYREYLHEHIDAKWLENTTFFKHYQILRNVSYLGRYPTSGLIFIFPKANESLRESEEAIKQIASRSLAPRVAILYLEYLVGRILTVTEGDARLHEHFMRFTEKYLIPTKSVEGPFTSKEE